MSPHALPMLVVALAIAPNPTHAQDTGGIPAKEPSTASSISGSANGTSRTPLASGREPTGSSSF